MWVALKRAGSFFVLYAIVLPPQLRPDTAQQCVSERGAVPNALWNQIARATEICPSVMAAPSLRLYRPLTSTAVSRRASMPLCRSHTLQERDLLKLKL